jgi:hypothetical protein
LPADFETFGQAVDTSLADLKGGTTGQVLSKASNTDMDFTWVAADDTDAIQNSIINAKGDLIAGSANDTPAILTAGNNGETLVADSSTSTGLRYTAGTVQSNPVLNSAFQIWQRGTSTSLTATSGGFVSDRWYTSTGANQACTISRQVTGDTTNLPFIQYAMRYQRNSGQTGTGGLFLTQSFETINSIPFAGKTVTVSFYARAGANYSAASSALPFLLISGTGTDQNRGTTGYTGEAYPISQTATLTTTWQRFTFTGSVAATATELALYFNFTPTGTAGANDWYELTGVQIDVGSVALPFRTNGETIQGELAACQRYYYRQAGGSPASPYAAGYADSTTRGVFPFRLPVTMRIEPSVIEFSGIGINFYGFGQVAVTSVTLDGTHAGPDVVLLIAAVASGLTQFRPYDLSNNNNSAGFIGLSAEL